MEHALHSICIDSCIVWYCMWAYLKLKLLICPFSFATSVILTGPTSGPSVTHLRPHFFHHFILYLTIGGHCQKLSVIWRNVVLGGWSKFPSNFEDRFYFYSYYVWGMQWKVQILNWCIMCWHGLDQHEYNTNSFY